MADEGYKEFGLTQPMDNCLIAKLGDRYISLSIPTSITASKNKVVATYGSGRNVFSQIITAEGEKNERHGFRCSIVAGVVSNTEED